MKLRVLDLFSGIGGFSLGLERTGGFETVAFCEIEPFPRRVLAKHWPGVPCYDDVRTLTGARLAADGIAVDVITGGFPCQGISIAGKGLGLADPRSGLWSETFRLIGELEPRYVFLENSAELLGRGLGDVLGDLAEIGYDAEWHCIPAGNLGAPHERDRIWVIAHPNGERCGEHNRPPLAIPPLVAGHTDHLGDALWQTPWEQVLENVCRMDDGLRGRMDKLGFQSLGNAVVPAIPQLMGHAIMQAEKLAWRRVMFAAECDPEGDGWCGIRDVDPAECDCIGPTQEGVEYTEIDGELYGRAIHQAEGITP